MIIICIALSKLKPLIYVHPGASSFIRQDIEYLKKEFHLTPYFFNPSNKLLLPFEFLKLFCFLLTAKKQDVLVSFGGYHSFIAALISRLKGNRIFVILNGVDSAAVPEINYGFLRKGVLRFCCKKSYQWADRILPVSESLMHTTNTYAFDDKKLGLNETFSKNEFKYEVIPNGFDSDFWSPESEIERGKSVITVASKNRIELKGVDLFLRLARDHPSYTFYIAGIDSLENTSSNVKCLGYLKPGKLRTYYSKSQFYFQLSVWEGFGCALCEAMLCGCVPIVSDVNVLKEIVGDNELVLMKKNMDSLISLTNSLINTQKNGLIYRERIRKKYPISQRVELIESIING